MSIPDLLRGSLRWGLTRKVAGRLELTPTGRRLLDDPQGLWWHVAHHWLSPGRVTAVRDAATLLLVELAVGVHVTGDAVAEAVAFGLDSLGWVDPVNHASIYEDLVWSLVSDDLPLLRALGVIGSPSPDQPLGTGPRARTFARAALQAHSDSTVGKATMPPVDRWRRRPTSGVRY